MFAEIIWDPDRNFFVIPYVNHPITWYGFFFAISFLIGFFLVRKMIAEFLAEGSKPSTETQLLAVKLTDLFAVLVVIGAVIGARLGHVFFYGWRYYQAHPWDIFKIWEGGLASHGGAIGVFIALVVFAFMCRKQAPKFTFLAALDTVVVPAAFAGGCIRIGNFINQEITGIPTRLPWGVIFLHPLDGVSGIPVHPVQLYESLFYFLVFIFLMILWKCRKMSLGLGLLSGWFFLLVFGFRFGIEYLKVPQNEVIDVQGGLRVGQLLSIPLVLLGAILLIRYYAYARKRR